MIEDVLCMAMKHNKDLAAEALGVARTKLLVA